MAAVKQPSCVSSAKVSATLVVGPFPRRHSWHPRNVSTNNRVRVLPRGGARRARALRKACRRFLIRANGGRKMYDRGTDCFEVGSRTTGAMKQFRVTFFSWRYRGSWIFRAEILTRLLGNSCRGLSGRSVASFATRDSRNRADYEERW